MVAGMNTSRTATIGGLMGLEMQNLGIVGLITDGLVRDAQEIRKLDLPVWCRGVTPIASNKIGEGATGIPINIGGVTVHDGDLVIADDDGVVIWQKEHIEELLQACLESIASGQDTIDSILARYPQLANELRPTLEAVRILVPLIQEQGYRLETVSQLLCPTNSSSGSAR